MLDELFAIEMPKLLPEAVIQSLTALSTPLSTAIILPFDNTVIDQRRILRDAPTGFAVSIESGDNVVEAALALMAGVVAFPASVNHKIIAVPAGFFFVGILNILRTISLTYEFNVPLMPILVPVCP